MRAFSHILHRFPAWPKHYNYENNFIISPFSKCSCCCCNDFVLVFFILRMNMYRLKLGILFNWWSIEHLKHTLNMNATTKSEREREKNTPHIDRNSKTLRYNSLFYWLHKCKPMDSLDCWHYTHFCGNLVKCKCWYKSFNMLHNPANIPSANARPRSTATSTRRFTVHRQEQVREIGGQYCNNTIKHTV